MGRFGLVLHGGADARPNRNYERELSHMRQLVERARDRLAAGGSALDVAIETVVDLESSGFYVAGRGASPNLDGVYELDAAVMDGTRGRAGAVAALQGFRSPISAARAVMDETPHVMLAGAGAAAFAAACGLARVDDPSWFTPAEERGSAPASHGTVGCVVRDSEGRLAAATSTGGTLGKMPGRVGDSPLVAAGVWADGRVAVSCTGQGEFFIRNAAAAQVSYRLRWAGEDIVAAAGAVITEIRDAGGQGGLIAIDADGRIAMPFASSGMKRAALGPDGAILAEAF